MYLYLGYCESQSFYLRNKARLFSAEEDPSRMTLTCLKCPGQIIDCNEEINSKDHVIFAIKASRANNNNSGNDLDAALQNQVNAASQKHQNQHQNAGSNRSSSASNRSSSASNGKSSSAGKGEAIPEELEFCFGGGSNMVESDIIARIKRLSNMSKAKLGGAISVMAEKGSDDPKSPYYVHPLIWEAAFTFYADKLNADEWENISPYLSSNHKAYKQIQWSAANALAAFAKNSGKNVLGKFMVSNEVRDQIVDILLKPVFALPIEDRKGSLVYEHAVWQLGNLYEDPVRTVGWSVDRTPRQFNAAAVFSLVLLSGGQYATAEGSVTAAQLGVALGEATLLVVAVGGATYLICDSYRPGLERRLQQDEEQFWNTVDAAPAEEWNGVESFPAFSEEDAKLIMTSNMSFTLADVQTKVTSFSKTKAREKMGNTCKYWNKSKKCSWPDSKLLKEILNCSDPETKEQCKKLEQPLRGDVKEKTYADLKNNPNIANKEQLMRVEAESCHFRDIRNQQLFVRAIYRNGYGWMPEAEVGIEVSSMGDLVNILGQNTIDLMKSYIIDPISRLRVSKDTIIRYGAHERQTGKPHLHWEELKTYPTSNPYICNHSLKWDPNSGINIL